MRAAAYLLIVMVAAATAQNGPPGGAGHGVTIPDDIPPPPQMPDQPQFPVCVSFPGTPAWNQCWQTFHSEISRFNNQIGQYGAAYRAWESKFPGEGSISMSNVNGVNIIARGISDVSTKSIRDRVYLDAFVGEEDLLEVSRTQNSATFTLTGRDGKVKHWIKITPPSEIGVDQIRFHRDEDMLHIWMKPRNPTLGSGSLFHSSWFSGK